MPLSKKKNQTHKIRLLLLLSGQVATRNRVGPRSLKKTVLREVAQPATTQPLEGTADSLVGACGHRVVGWRKEYVLYFVPVHWSFVFQAR